MQGVPQHRDGQHEPARLVVCLAKHVFRKMCRWNFRVGNFFGFRHALARPRGCRRGAHSSRTVSSRRRRPEPRRPTGAPRQRPWAGTASHFIPACAGSTGSVGSPCPWPGGSSPHVRGALHPAAQHTLVVGIIPACAGSTGAGQARRPAVRNHPHMRGEHTLQSAYCGGGNGSSPHARGAREVSGLTVPLGGIIPACAGSTVLSSYLAVHLGDYPRMRGEHGPSWEIAWCCLGSSPHAQGARRRAVGQPHGRGIIPACAGSTNSLPHFPP